MAIDRTGISSLQTGAPEITYTGDEGPKSPSEREMEMAGMMNEISLAFEQQNGYDISLATPEVRENFIQQWKEENFYDRSRAPVQDRGDMRMASADPILEDEYNKYVFELKEIRPEATPMSFKEFIQQIMSEARMGVADGGIMRTGFAKCRWADPGM